MTNRQFKWRGIAMVLILTIGMAYAPRGLTAEPIVITAAAPCGDFDNIGCISWEWAIPVIMLRDDLRPRDDRAMIDCLIKHEKRHEQDRTWQHEKRALPGFVGIRVVDCGDGNVVADMPRLPSDRRWF